VLEVVGLDAGYGPLPVLRSVGLSVAPGEIVALLGANGAGKSTLLRTVSGLLRPSAGAVLLDGADIAGVPAHEIAARGVGHVPEGRRVFPAMTVAENLLMGAYRRRGAARFRLRLRRRRCDVAAGGDVAGDLDAVFALFPRLADRRRQAGGSLSGGEQQMLAIGRALMGRPRLLLLDEPTMGLAPLLAEQIFVALARIRADGVGMLVVEQNARAALGLAARGYVLEGGRIVAADTAAGLRGDDRVRRAYLGDDPVAAAAEPAPRR
jgi:branched-chain amino acid transport system ATP-binding protein